MGKPYVMVIALYIKKYKSPERRKEMDAIKTRSAIAPAVDDRDVPYKIKTSQAEEYIQKKLDIVCSMMRQNGKDQPDVKFNIMTTQMGKLFFPMLGILPIDIISETEDDKKEVHDIFNPGSSKQFPSLKKEFWTVLQPWLYSKQDEDVFFNQNTRSALRMSLAESHKMKNYRQPKLYSFNKGRTKVLLFMIDPVRLFKDMMTDVNNEDQKFDVIINRVTQINDTNYRYDITRSTSQKKKKNNNNDNRIFKEIERRIKN